MKYSCVYVLLFIYSFYVGCVDQATSAQRAVSFEQNDLFPLPPIREWIEMIQQIMNTTRFIDYYLPRDRQVENKECLRTSQKFILDFANREEWALKMFDSWGKIPDGFLYGNLHPIGMFEECIELEARSTINGNNVHFEGKYCTIQFRTSNVTLGDFGSGNSDFGRSGPFLIVINAPIPFSYATCMPSICNPEDLAFSLNELYAENDREVSNIYCTGEDDDLDEFDITVIVFIVVLIVLAIVGSIMDLANAESKWFRPFKAYSAPKNFVAIFTYKDASPNEITCLHGIRAITLIWITTCHQYEIPLSFIANTLDTEKYQDDVIAQVITNGWPSVDTFLTLSGIMIACRLLPPLLENRNVNPVLIFLRRILRLMPSILMVAMFSATLLRYLGWGPRNFVLKKYSLDECRDYWWTDPLFVDNFVTGDGDDNIVHDCLGHCWFTAILMQLFLITPLILIPLKKNFKFGLYWLGILTVGSMIIPIAISLAYDFPPSPLANMVDQELSYDYMTKFYMTPWCRAGPWLVGIWAGILIAKQPVNFPRPIKPIFVVLGYALAIGIGLAVALGLYDYNHIGDHDEYTKAVSAMYAGFSRHAWGAAISFVVVACHFGYSAPVNNMLSWKGWRPISRLTFCMYLVTPVVQTWWTTVLYLPSYYSYFYKLFEVCGIFFISLLFGLILSLLVERPIMNLFSYFSPSPLEKLKSKQQKRPLEDCDPTS